MLELLAIRMFILYKYMIFIMEDVNLTFKVFWRFKDFHHLKITNCKKIIDCKKGRLLNYTTRGFFIGGRYLKRNQLKYHIEKIPTKEILPF